MSVHGRERARQAVVVATPTLSAEEFGLFRTLIEREAGICLGEHKRALVAGRLSRRLRELALGSFRAYYERVVHDEGSELQRLLDCICTNETRFFREADQFAFLEERAIAELAGLAAAGRIPKRVRAWSAACSTGEEPFSLAMTLRARFPRESGWELEVVASDLSTRALARAEAAVWPLAQAAEIPERHRRRFMLRGTGSQLGKMKASAELRAIVRFCHVNLNDEHYPLAGSFDLLLCRNVLMYFGAAARAAALARLLARMQPHGYLFLGHAESLTGLSHDMESVAPNVYRRRAS